MIEKTKEVRSILEQKNEYVKNTVFEIMPTNTYTNYETACTLLNLEPLYIY